MSMNAPTKSFKFMAAGSRVQAQGWGYINDNLSF